ncbi:unnamed protein product [Parajaminaea phylloscopi]
MSSSVGFPPLGEMDPSSSQSNLHWAQPAPSRPLSYSHRSIPVPSFKMKHDLQAPRRDEEDICSQDEHAAGSTSTLTAPPGQRRKRAKHGAKIKRNRKITSCLACRERKQKCDRTHPTCEKCIEDGRQCVYVDNDAVTSDAAAAASDELSPEIGTKRPRPPVAGGKGNAEPEDEDFLRMRRQGLRRTFEAGRDRARSFQERVKAARAGCVAEVLFAENGASDRKLHPGLRLPTAKQAQDLLDIYKEDVQCVSNILIIDLNRARINSFLEWWHSGPLEMPIEADAPLAPLVLVVLALSLQAKRARDAIEQQSVNGHKGAYSPNRPTSCESLYPWISTERYLLETAGRCVNALQIVCPSSWAAAYSAPLDVVRAEALRALWHLGECHLQFAASCLSTAVRLAYAAGLHRDPKHWGPEKMGPFEAQARRSAWWNIVALDAFHSLRLGQPMSIAHSEMDTELPLDFDTILEQYQITSNPHGRPSRLAFDAITARFLLASLIVRRSKEYPPMNDPSSTAQHDFVRICSDVYESWGKMIPKQLRKQMDESEKLEYWHRLPADGRWEVIGLQLNHLQGCIASHRPQGEAEASEAMPAFKSSLQSATRIVALCHLGITGRPCVPALLLNIFVYHLFNIGCFLAIQSVQKAAVKSLCEPALAQALSALDLLAENHGLWNISELASKYASAIRGVCREGDSTNSKPGRVVGIRGDSGADRVADPRRHELPSPLMTAQPSEHSAHVSPATRHIQQPLRQYGSAGPMMPPGEGPGHSGSASGAMQPDSTARWNMSVTPSRNSPLTIEPKQHQAPSGLASSSQPMVEGSVSGPLTSQAGRMLNVSAPSGFFGANDSGSLMVDRPLPGSNQVSPSFLSALMSDFSDDLAQTTTAGLDLTTSADATNASVQPQDHSPWSEGHGSAISSALSGMVEGRDGSAQQNEQSNSASHHYQPSGGTSAVEELRGNAALGSHTVMDGSGFPRNLSGQQHPPPSAQPIATIPRQGMYRSEANAMPPHAMPPFGPIMHRDPGHHMGPTLSPFPTHQPQEMHPPYGPVGHPPQFRDPQAGPTQLLPEWHNWDHVIGGFLHDTHNVPF